MLRRALSLVCFALQAACASDTAPLPHPALDEPGTFVALDEEGSLSLLRTLDRLELQDDTGIFFTVYDVAPASYEDARETSKRTDLPLRREAELLSKKSFGSKTYRVVWFRTLTQEEEARVQ